MPRVIEAHLHDDGGRYASSSATSTTSSTAACGRRPGLLRRHSVDDALYGGVGPGAYEMPLVAQRLARSGDTTRSSGSAA